MRDGSGRHARQLGDVFYSNATHTRGFSLRSVWRRKVGRDEAAFLISPLYVKSFAEQCYNSLPYLKRFFFRNLTLHVFKELPFPSVSATDVASWTLQEPAPGPTATTKYVAGVVPTFLIPCSSLECTNPTEPGPRRQLDRPFSNQPHFRVHMVVRRVGRSARGQRCFMHLQRLAGGQLALQNIADLRVVRRSNRQLFERIHCRCHRSLLCTHALGPQNGGEKSCRKQEAQITSRDGHLHLLL